MHELIFHTALVGRMPEEVVAGLITHELAHVVLLALGDTSSGELCEYRTDDLVSAWGYQPADTSTCEAGQGRASGGVRRP